MTHEALRRARSEDERTSIRFEANAMKCVACGSVALVEGLLQGEDASRIGFQAADAGPMRRMFALGRRKVRGYGCIRCGYLQFAVEFTDEDRERYQQFEGKQPGVLERITREEDRE
jgi:hypothetical protein